MGYVTNLKVGSCSRKLKTFTVGLTIFLKNLIGSRNYNFYIAFVLYLVLLFRLFYVTLFISTNSQVVQCYMLWYNKYTAIVYPSIPKRLLPLSYTERTGCKALYLTAYGA